MVLSLWIKTMPGTSNGLPKELRAFWVADEYRTHPWSHIGHGYDVVVVYRASSARAYDSIQVPPFYIQAIYEKNEDNPITSIYQSIYARYRDSENKHDQPFVKVWTEADYNEDYNFTYDDEFKERFNLIKADYDKEVGPEYKVINGQKYLVIKSGTTTMRIKVEDWYLFNPAGGPVYGPYDTEEGAWKFYEEDRNPDGSRRGGWDEGAVVGKKDVVREYGYNLPGEEDNEIEF